MKKLLLLGLIISLLSCQPKAFKTIIKTWGF